MSDPDRKNTKKAIHEARMVAFKRSLKVLLFLWTAFFAIEGALVCYRYLASLLK